MDLFWILLTFLHSLSGPVLMLLYPLYASVIAIESPSREDDEQWLAYWILYSFLTLIEMLLQSLLEWIPIWYTAKLVLVAWLVLPQLRGATYVYERFVREHVRRYTGHQLHHASRNGSGKGCEQQVTEAEKGSSDELRNERIMRLSWALVHSRQPDDVQRGIAMLEYGVIGIGIAGIAVDLVVGGIAAALARRN